MDPGPDLLEPIREAVCAGNVAAALELTERWIAAGRARDALLALYTIGEARPEERARIAARMGELHASLGELREAAERFEIARRFGAPDAWVNERLAELARRASDADAYLGPAARDPGWWNQKGVTVLRRAYVAFIPTERATHVASIAAKALLAAGTGVLVLRTGERMQPSQLLPYLRSLQPAALDLAARDLAQSAGGVVYASDRARYRLEKLPLGVRISFVSGPDRILALNAKALRTNAIFQRIAASWPPDR